MARSAPARPGCSTAAACRSLRAPGWRRWFAAPPTAVCPVAVHAIGDLANREALDAFEATAAVWRGLRPRIEHAQCVHPDDQARFASLGVTASVQYSHGVSDRDLAARLWAERLEWAYPYRALLDAGARLAGGSDAPVEPLDPLAGLRAAVALDVPLVCGAVVVLRGAGVACSGQESSLGRLAVGYEADLVVLDRDPFVDLAGCSVVATMVRGSWVFGAPPSGAD